MKKIAIIAIILSSLAGACTKEEITPRSYPRVKTVEATDITSGGATFRGEIFFTSVPILDHGFLWSEQSNPTLNGSDKISLGSKSGTGSFDAKCERSMQEGKKYYMRAYALSEDNAVYGNVVEFQSLGSKAPVLKDFFPSTATWDDTVTIVGENFSSISANNTVKFNEIKAHVLSASPDTLKVKVPNELHSDLSTVSVSYSGNVSTATKKLQLEAPMIESVSPGVGIVGTSVTLKGKFFVNSNTKIYFGNIEADANTMEWGFNTVKVKVPEHAPGGIIEMKVVTGTGALFDTAPFEILAPQITEISPTISSYEEIITIKGKFFGPDIESNIVKFDDAYTQVITASTTELTVLVPGAVTRSNPTISVNSLGLTGSFNGFSYLPPEITSISPSRGSSGTEIIISGKYFNPYYTKVFLDDQPLDYVGVYSSTEIRVNLYGPLNKHSASLKVLWHDQEATSNQDFNIPLIQLEDYTCDYLLNSISMVYNNKAYVGLGGYQGLTKHFWNFDPALRQWNRLNDFPGSERSEAVSFVVSNRGYVGGGTIDATDQFKDLWEYNFATDEWIKKADLPITSRADAAFSIGGAAYLIENNYETSTPTLWKYNPASDTWLLKSIPGDTHYRNVHFVANGALYILDHYNLLWRFIASTEQWTAVGYTPTQFDFVFSSKNFGFAGTSTALFRFDPTTNTWTDDIWTGNLRPDMTITINDKGYMLGHEDHYNRFCFEYDASY